MKEDDLKANNAWDARQGFVIILCRLAQRVLFSTKNNPHEWFENLEHFEDWAALPLKEYPKKDLTKIKELIYGKCNASDKLPNLDKACDQMRAVFRKTNKELWNQGYYIPMKDVYNPGDAILEMGE